MLSKNKIRTKAVNRIIAKFYATVALLLVMLGLSNCSGLGVYDDLEECPRGVVMRFIFDP